MRQTHPPNVRTNYTSQARRVSQRAAFDPVKNIIRQTDVGDRESAPEYKKVNNPPRLMKASL